MIWPFRIEDAFNIVRPLTPEEKQSMLDVQIDLANRKPVVIQDAENPVCPQCGCHVTVEGICERGCGRVKERIR